MRSLILVSISSSDGLEDVEVGSIYMKYYKVFLISVDINK